MPKCLGNLKYVDEGVYSKMHEMSGRVYDPHDISPAIHTQSGGGQGIKILITDDDASNIRRLTPRECWRLQDFSDKDFDKASDVCSDTQLYKQAGNAAPVGVIEAIFSNLQLTGGVKTDLSDWLNNVFGKESQ